MSSDISKRRKAAAEDQSSVYQDRRAALFAAAAEIFREQGLDGASLNEIAGRAGLDRASLYYYVASKEELYRQVVDSVVRSNVEAVLAVRDGEGTGADKLGRAVKLLMESYAANYPHLYIFVAEDFGRRGSTTRQGRSSKAAAAAAAWRQELSSLGDRYYEAVRSIVTEGFEDGTLQSDLTAGVVAHGVIGMTSWTHRWFRPDGPSSADTVADGFVAIMLQGLSADA